LAANYFAGLNALTTITFTQVRNNAAPLTGGVEIHQNAFRGAGATLKTITFTESNIDMVSSGAFSGVDLNVLRFDRCTIDDIQSGSFNQARIAQLNFVGVAATPPTNPPAARIMSIGNRAFAAAEIGQFTTSLVHIQTVQGRGFQFRSLGQLTIGAGTVIDRMQMAAIMVEAGTSMGTFMFQNARFVEVEQYAFYFNGNAQGINIRGCTFERLNDFALNDIRSVYVRQISIQNNNFIMMGNQSTPVNLINGAMISRNVIGCCPTNCFRLNQEALKPGRETIGTRIATERSSCHATLPAYVKPTTRAEPIAQLYLRFPTAQQCILTWAQEYQQP